MICRIRSILWVLLAVLGACAGTRCDGPKDNAPKEVAAVKAPRPDLRLLITTDPRGYLEPCGCQLVPLGGLDKLATVIAEKRSDDVPTLLLAAGNLVFGTELRPEDAKEAEAQERYRAEAFTEIYKLLGVAAVAPGAADLAQDPALRAKLIAQGGFPWLVDNAKAGEDSHFSAARVIDVHGIKVGLLGLVAPDPARPAHGAQLGEELTARAAEQSKALRDQGAKLVIALVSADRRTARAIASHGADVVVMGGLDLEQALPPAVAGDAVLLSAGYQGQHVLSVDVGLREDRPWEDASPWTREERKKEAAKQVKELRARVTAWESDPNVDQNDLATQRARLTELERLPLEEAQPTYAKRWFRAELIPLTPDVKGEHAIAAMLDEHDHKVNEHNRVALAGRKPLPAKAGDAHFVGSEACNGCHQPAFAWWQRTKHGSAYATLENVHKEYNLNCVSCHVTGYNVPGGSTVTHVGALKDVGCESCHGAGSKHVALPKEQGLIARQVPESTCASCHTHEHSARFMYDAFKTMLIVPGHGRPTDRQ